MSVPIVGEIAPGHDLASRYDHLAALLTQIHRHAAEGLAGLRDDALTTILAESVLPCPARVTVLRGKDVLIEALRGRR